MASDTDVYAPVCISDAVDPADGREDAASGRDSLPIDQEYGPLEDAAVASSVGSVDGGDGGRGTAEETLDLSMEQSRADRRTTAEDVVDSSSAAATTTAAVSSGQIDNDAGHTFADSSLPPAPSAPAAAAAVADQQPHIPPSQQQQLPMTAPGFPAAGLQFPFFANPFMTPYLPQATMGVVPQQPQQQQLDAAHPMMPVSPEQTMTDPNFRMNPFTGGYYLAPVKGFMRLLLCRTRRRRRLIARRPIQGGRYRRTHRTASPN